LVQLVFEQLYQAGIRDFCFVIGRGKRVIEDHFTQDYGFVKQLAQKQKNDSATELESFYERVDNSSITWINQPQPKGFGDAVLRTSSWVGEHDFLVHAGDAYIISKDNDHLTRLFSVFSSAKACAAFFVKKTKRPQAKGVVRATAGGNGVYRVHEVIEKPSRPISNLAIEPVYAFKPLIFQSLRFTKPGVGNEIQLTDAIQRLAVLNERIFAVELTKNDVRLDIGDPESYGEALRLSFDKSV
jgi:UTP--glucose-1-phosphate uridylyltransferase